MKIRAIAACALLAGCTQASPVMSTGDGAYFISTRAHPASGGTTGAYSRAYEEATKFCVSKGAREAILISAQDRDTYSSGYGGGFSGTPTGGYSGAMAGGTSAWGNAAMRFRCG